MIAISAVAGRKGRVKVIEVWVRRCVVFKFYFVSRSWVQSSDVLFFVRCRLELVYVWLVYARSWVDHRAILVRECGRFGICLLFITLWTKSKRCCMMFALQFTHTFFVNYIADLLGKVFCGWV